MMWNPEECVERGMEWLDQHYPDWLGRIQPEHLDLGHCSLCVLGQLGGEEALAGGLADGYDLLRSWHCLDTGELQSMGFYVSDKAAYEYCMSFPPDSYNKAGMSLTSFAYAHLTEAWRTAIYARREAKQASLNNEVLEEAKEQSLATAG